MWFFSQKTQKHFRDGKSSAVSYSGDDLMVKDAHSKRCTVSGLSL